MEGKNLEGGVLISVLNDNLSLSSSNKHEQEQVETNNHAQLIQTIDEDKPNYLNQCIYRLQ